MFQFKKANCVVVDTFNMYILHPQWLERHHIIEAIADVAIETNLTQPGFRFRFPKDKSTWSVTPTRLEIESQDPRTDCGKMVAELLKVLPETPLFALGNNAHYQAELSERENLSPPIRDFPETEPPTKEQFVLQRTFQAGIKRSERVTANLRITLKEDGIELGCNIHNELGNRDDANKVAVAAADQFFGDRAETAALAQHFFGTSIDHDSGNS